MPTSKPLMATTAEKVRFKPFGIELRVNAPEDLHSELLDKSAIYLPLGVSYNIATTQQIEINVERGAPRLEIENFKANLTSDSKNNSIVSDTLLIASRLLEKALNQNGIFSMHASGVSYNGKAVLILGPYGSGKTTTAFNACMKNYTIRYVTGNRPFLKTSTNEILYGMNSHASLQRSSLVSELGIRSDALASMHINKGDDPSVTIQSSRVVIDPSAFGVQISSFPLDLEALVMVRKSHRDLVSYEPGTISEREIMAIYYALCEYSESIYVMFGPRLIFPNILSEEEKRKRFEYAERLSKSTRIIYAEGKLNDLSAYITKLLRK